MSRAAALVFVLLCRSRICLVATAAVIAALALVPGAARADERLHDRVIANELDRFATAYLGRQINSDELEILTDEFLRTPPRRNMTRRQLQDHARSFGSHAPVLRDDPDGPRAARIRAQLLAANYFTPSMQHTLTLQVLQAPDPVRVVDARGKHVMTESAVVALANLLEFATATGAPVHHPLSHRAIAKISALLDRKYGSQPSAARMPQFFGDAAAFWAGVQREWPQMTRKDRQLARQYVAQMAKPTLPVELYARLWGYDSKEAVRLQAQRTNDAIRENMAATTQIWGMSMVNSALWH